MTRYIQGSDRSQVTFLLECLDVYTNEDKRHVRVVCNPCRISRGWPGGDAENSRFDPGLLTTQLSSDGNWAEFYERGF